MNFRKFAQSAGILARRDTRHRATKKASQRIRLEFMPDELEKRQLLASFSYSSGLLTIQTDSANEQLSIISTSESGNYTITTTGSWSGSASDITASGASLYVNQPLGLASILVNDNGGTVSGSAFSFGSSSANFVDDLTVSFTNASAGGITVGNSARFIGGSNVSLTGSAIGITADISTVDGDLSLTGTGAIGTNNIYGVGISGATVSTANGLLTINGTSCGTGSRSRGVQLDSATVSATGTGFISITANAAQGGSQSYGLFTPSSTIQAANGSIFIDAISNGIGEDSGYLDDGSSLVSVSGTGSITIYATGSTVSHCAGANLRGRFTTANGDINLIGVTRGTNDSHGVTLEGVTIIANGTGIVSVYGSGGNLANNRQDIQSWLGSRIQANEIALTGNHIYFQTTDGNFTASRVTIQTLGTGIELGGGGSESQLGLTQADLNQFHTSNLTLGNGLTGNISLASNVTWSSNLSMYSVVPIAGTLSNSSHTFTQGSYTITATGSISTTSYSLEVSTNADSGSGSLRDAVAFAALLPGDDEIIFSSTLTGSTITLATPITINDGTGNLTITGLGASNLAIGGGGSSSLFNVVTNTALSGLTFQNATGTNGGAFYSTSNLSLSNVSINNTSATLGAAIYQTGGSLSLTTSDIADSIYVTGNANYTVSGGSLGQSVAVNNGNVVSITNYDSNLTLGAINAESLTVSTNTTTSTISVSGPVAVTGLGSVSLIGEAISVTGNITTVDGDLSLTGVGATGTNNIYGVGISGATVSTANGLLTINGTSCGTGSNAHGVYFSGGSVVSATGTGNISISANSAQGGGSSRGLLTQSSTINTSNGSISINAISSGSGGENGYQDDGSSLVSVDGTGSININATGGTGSHAAGASLRGRFTTANGDITLIGATRGTDNSHGVTLEGITIIANGTGAVSVYGSGGSQANSRQDIHSWLGARIQANQISLTGNNIYFQNTNGNFTASSVTILTRGTGIELGGGGSESQLGLTQADLNQFHTSNLTLGNGLTGNISLASNVTWSSNLSMYSGVPIAGTLSNSSHTFTQGSYTITATGSISTTSYSLEVSTNADSGSGSLRDAVAFAALLPGDDEITFSSTLTGSTITLATPITINDGTGNLTITGLGASNLTIGGGGSSSLFNVVTNTTLSGLTFQNATGTNGGAFYSTSNLSLSNVSINNTSATLGAAIYQTGGSLSLTTSDIADSIYVTGNANYTVSGGSLGQSVAVNNGNVVSITNYDSNLTLGAINAESLTVSTNTTTSIISVSGPVSVTGLGSVSLIGEAISVTGNITTVDGDLSLTGVGATGTNNIYGVGISGATVSTANGLLTINGTSCGTGSRSRGVQLDSATVSATGTGFISITANAAQGGSQSYGLFTPSSTIQAANGSIFIDAISNGIGEDSGYLDDGSSLVSVSGTGSITIYATGSTVSHCAGANLRGRFTTANGDINLIGVTRGTDNSHGVTLEGVTIIANGTGIVSVYGSGGNLANDRQDIQSWLGSRIQANEIALTGNHIYFQTTDGNFTASRVTIQTLGTGIELGGGGSESQLGLTQADLNQFHTSNLTLGNGLTGNISLASSVTWSSNLSMYSGVPIVGTVSNSSHTFTQGSNTLTATGSISATFINLLEVTTNADSGAGSLRSVVAYAASHSGDDDITFNSSLLSSTITLATPITINDSSGNLTITGLGAGNLTIGGSSSLFTVQSNTTLTGLTFTNTLTSISNLTLANVATSYSTAVTQTGGSLTINSSNVVNSVVIAGGADFTVVGGSLGSSVSISSGNQVSITGLTQDIALGTINAGELTVTTDTTSNSISVTGPVALTGSGAMSLAGRNIVVTGDIDCGGNALTITGNLVSNGSMSNLTNLSVSGSSNLTGTVSTNGTQTFTGNLTVNGALTLLSNGNAVRVDGQVISARGPSILTSFTAVGNSTFTVPAGVTMVDVLIVAGGGGGTLDSGGGGGGGQVLDLSDVSVSGTVNVVVGAGGAGTFYTGSTPDRSGGAVGGNSTFGSYTAGGGGGGVSRWGNYNNGYTGGGGVQEGFSVKTGYGNISGGQGRGWTSTNGAGGGGGAGGNGASASSSSGGAGGIGISSNITGTPTYYGGGGGGSVDYFLSIPAGAGGLGGGGSGTGGLSGNLDGANGTANTGGGGGGGTNVKNGGNGGSGIVIVRVNSLSSFTINAGAGSVALNGAVGAGSALTSMNITAGNISLGSVNATSLTLNSTAAALSASDAITVSGTANLTAAGDISLANATNNFGTVTACGTNITIYDPNDITIGAITATGDFTVQGVNSTSCISVTGPVNATGGAGNVTLTGRNIVVTGNITTAGGDIKLYGNGDGSYQSGSFDGVRISGSAVNVNTTSGNITIDGRGGLNTACAGVNLTSSTVQAGGSGSLSIVGVSGNGTGSSAYGVFANAATVKSSTGLLAVNGTSCATGTGSAGVFLNSSSNISATGVGSVTITGNTPGNSTTGIGINSTDSGSIIYANGGLITLTANSVNLTGTVNATTAGNVLIQTLGVGVNLGGTDNSSNLGLNQSELNQITANQLIIGDRATNTTISLTQNMSWSTNISLLSNLPITGMLSNSDHTFTQRANTLTATGTIVVDSPTVNYTVLVSSNFPVTYGTSVLLTASLTHSGSAFNSGTVSFYNNGVLLGSGNITNDVANYTWSGASAGTYANITATGLVPGGTDNGSNTASVIVNQANLTITANNAAKTYDANAFTGGNGVSYSGFVAGENSTVLSGTLVYGGDSQGAINAGSYAITPSNLTSSNYNITFANGSLTVATAPLTITANGATKNYGSDLSGQMGLQTSGYTLTGLQGSDTVTNVTLTSTGAAPTANIGSYNITPSAANSAALANYNITYANGSLTVNQANLTVTSSSSSKQYGLGSPLNNATGFTNGTMYNGDTIASVNLVSTGEALTSNVGSYGITASGASLAATGVGNISNYNITYASTGSLSVIQAPMTLTAENRTKRYGDSLTLGTTCFTLSGMLYNGDTITNATLTAPQAANASAPIGNYPIAPSAAVAGNTGVGNISNYNINYTNGTLAVWESLSTTVTSSSDVSNPFDDQVTLREAIDYGTQLTGNRTISFAQSIFSSNATTITLTQGVLAVNDNSGTLNIQGPLVSSANRLTVSGGNSSGIFSLATPTIISNMTLSGGNAGTGAGIYNNATTSLTGLTIQDNVATDGAGLYNAVNGNLTITNSTIANNTASTHGGAIDNNGGTVTLYQTTIAFNNAANGGGIDNFSGTVNLVNTLVANNTGSVSGPDVLGTVNANYSLIGNTSGTTVIGSNNQQNVNSLLGSLDYYGGNTKVYPLLPGSPAINTGTGSGVSDQRGITVAGTADMGSFQSRGFNISRTGGNCQTSMIGDAFPTNLSLSVASNFSEPVNGGVITFTAPSGANTPSANLTGSTTISGGNVSVQATANAYYGSAANQNYNITANASGANGAASYQLLNVGTPATINITSGNNQSGNLTGNFAQTLGINVKDSVGNNIPRLSVTFTPNTTGYGAKGNIAGNGNGVTYTGTTDSNGNISGLTYATNGIGGLVTVVANATVTQIPGVRPQATSTANFYEGAVGMTIQNGTAGRSFVNSAAIMVGNATLASYLLTSGRAVLQFLGFTGTSNATAPAGVANISASSGSLIWNYGSNGITGDPNSQNGDGVYQLAVDYNGDGHWTYVKFHRLFGDVNGDRLVDTADYNLVINPSVYGKSNITSGANTNGQGMVYSKDVITVLRQRGRRVSYNVY